LSSAWVSPSFWQALWCERLIEDDPNLTDKKFQGNPTRSYRTQQPLRIIARS